MGAFSRHRRLSGAGRRFATTRWSVVVAAADRAAPDSRGALEALCQAYWYPVYAYVRRRGHGVDDARDLTQEFFAALIERDWLQAADRDRGRFRTFLLTAVSRLLSKERDRRHAAKRGGGKAPVSIDAAAGEERYRLEPAHVATPERLFERRWALMLLDQTLARLAEEYARQGKSKLFRTLQVYLSGAHDGPTQAAVATELGMSEGAVRVAVHRLRRRYRDVLRDEVAQTVATADEIDDELRHLQQVVGGM